MSKWNWRNNIWKFTFRTTWQFHLYWHKEYCLVVVKTLLIEAECFPLSDLNKFFGIHRLDISALCQPRKRHSLTLSFKNIKRFTLLYWSPLLARSRRLWFHENCPGNSGNISESESSNTAQKIKFSFTDLFSKCDQIRRKLQIWSHLLKKYVMENFIFCVVKTFNKYFCFSRWVLELSWNNHDLSTLQASVIESN